MENKQTIQTEKINRIIGLENLPRSYMRRQIFPGSRHKISPQGKAYGQGWIKSDIVRL